MDPENFLQIADQVSKLNMFPYFELAHCLVMCAYFKDELQQGAHLFSRKHPICCWASCMLSIYGGQMLVACLLGEPILAVFKNSNSLLVATGSWYLIFYMPFDLGYKIFKFLPVKIILATMKEIMRCHKVHQGVLHAAKIYPSGYLIMVICGTLKGNGSAFLNVIGRLMRGSPLPPPSAMELMQMTFPTKACIAASVIFVLDQKTDLISAPHALVYFGLVIFFAYFKLSSMLLGIHDPFVPFENLFCAIFLGGIWDTLQRLLTPAKGDQSAVKSDAAKNGKTDSAKKKE